MEAARQSPELTNSLEFLKRDLNLRPVTADHLLRRRPFFFNAWPQPLGRSLELWWDDGLLVLIGSLTDLWSHPQLTRIEIRDVHEWGINLLHFVWQRQHFRRLLQ